MKEADIGKIISSEKFMKESISFGVRRKVEVKLLCQENARICILKTR